LIEIDGTKIIVAGRFPRIARLDAEKYHFIEDPKPLIDCLKARKPRIDLFTFTQTLSETSPKFAFPFEWDNLAALPISTFEHWWEKQIGFKARNKAKQAAKKGVILCEVPFNADLIRGIWEVYNECPVRQGKPFRHYGKSIEQVEREEATYLEDSVFIGAFLEGKLIGFIKMVMDRQRTQAGLMNIVSMIGHRDLAPTNALVAEAVRSATTRGIRFLVYSNFSYGNKLRDSVTDFKERNGFQQVNLPRYYVPLTPWGGMALRLGLHRAFRERIPESVAVKLRQLRNRWYSRRFNLANQPS
jgi:hypothetical protein